MRFEQIEGDALETMRGMADSSVSLIATDPPYFEVKDEAWDNQWKDAEAFLSWMNDLCVEWKRILKPNGSLYVFASPQMGRRVGNVIARHFNILTDIRWAKPEYSTKAEMFRKEDLRAPFPSSETIWFAEQWGADKPFSDALIDGNQTYWSACEATKRSIFGDYMRSEFARAGVTNKQVAALFPSASGGLTGCVSNWLLGYNCPTPEQYQTMRAFLGCGYLSREYEDLRREYEDLRRPFNASPDAPYTDVWTFPTVGYYEGKHPCEKPLEMAQHIVSLSSRPGDVVLDCFSGSGVMGEAAVGLGREAICIDNDPHWCEVSRARMSRASGVLVRMPKRPTNKHAPTPLLDLLTA